MFLGRTAGRTRLLDILTAEGTEIRQDLSSGYRIVHAIANKTFTSACTYPERPTLAKNSEF